MRYNSGQRGKLFFFYFFPLILSTAVGLSAAMLEHMDVIEGVSSDPANSSDQYFTWMAGERSGSPMLPRVCWTTNIKGLFSLENPYTY